MPDCDILTGRLENGYIFGDKWEIIKYINGGGCSNVYLVKDQKGNEYAAKVSIEQFSYILSHEYSIYKLLRDCIYAPKLPRRSFGYSDEYTYMIMDLLGNNIRQFRRRFPSKQVPLEIIQILALQIIDFLEYFHNIGYLYVDVKPENFMLNDSITNKEIFSSSELMVYCIDFGLSQKYIINGRHRACKKIKSRTGTINFMSINVESKILPSRRDDIESFAYVLIFLQKGNLPWEKAIDETDGFKLKCNIENYIVDINPNILKILHMAKSYTYDEKPDYKLIKDLIMTIET